MGVKLRTNFYQLEISFILDFRSKTSTSTYFENAMPRKNSKLFTQQVLTKWPLFFYLMQ